MTDKIRQAAEECAKELKYGLKSDKLVPIVGEGDYVAWCRYAEHSIVTCDSDAPGAFKVYRGPRQVPEETVSSEAHQRWMSERKKQDPLNPQPIAGQEELVQRLVEKWQEPGDDANIKRMIGEEIQEKFMPTIRAYVTERVKEAERQARIKEKREAHIRTFGCEPFRHHKGWVLCRDCESIAELEAKR